MIESKFCKWVIRPGNHDSLWAFTPCKTGYNPLTKVNRVSEVEDAYNGRLCPICGRTIKIDLSYMCESV